MPRVRERPRREVNDETNYVYMYIGFICCIISIAGYVLFLNGWNPIVSIAMMFIGLFVLINMSRRAMQSVPPISGQWIVLSLTPGPMEDKRSPLTL